MLDEVNLSIKIPTPEEVKSQTHEPFSINGLELKPKWRENNVITYHGKHRNIKLSIINDHLRISNSWHKLHKGNNYSDFPFSEVMDAFDEISGILNIDLAQAEIKRLAYGCVLDVDPLLNYPNWGFYKSKPPLKMIHRNKEYGRIYKLTNYSIKGYDKTFEAKEHDDITLPPNKFRIELSVLKMPYFKDKIKLHTPQDLLNYKTMEYLKNDLLIKYKSIEKTTPINYVDLTTMDIMLLHTMKDETARKELKRLHDRTYKRYLKRYKELLGLQDNMYFGKIETQLKDKLEFLLTN